MHFLQESSCLLHFRTKAFEHRAAVRACGAELPGLLPPPLPLLLRVLFGALPWPLSSAWLRLAAGPRGASPLLPVEPGLLAVALLARAAATAAAGPCLVGAREPWPGSEEQRPPLAGAGGRLADVPWLLPAPPVLLLQAAAAAALVSC